jgi:hypothetical protein
MFELRMMAVVALLFVVAPGCFSGDPKTHPVHGKVLFPDGKPLTKGSVEFELVDQEKPSTATGEISDDGTFELGTYKPDDGAIAGRHRAVVIADHEIGTGVELPKLTRKRSVGNLASGYPGPPHREKLPGWSPL